MSLANPKNNTRGSVKMKWTPDKVTALILLLGCLGLLFTGIDGEVKSILTLAAGWLFGGAWSERRKAE